MPEIPPNGEGDDMPLSIKNSGGSNVVSLKKKKEEEKDPKFEPLKMEVYFEVAGETYGGLIFYKLDLWWRNSRLYIDGYRWTNVTSKMIAEEFKMSPKTVQRALLRLEKGGLIQSAHYRKLGLHQKLYRVFHEDMEPVTPPSQQQIQAALKALKWKI